ncbi:MAG: hypothetical protein K6A44_02820 [bacterium]|nr:hypothetical protein [bacterium]
MQVNFGTKTGVMRCVKRFKPLPIVPMFSQNNTRYFLFGKNNTLIGAFNYDRSGILSNVNLDERIKRTKTAADAIFSIKDFVTNMAKKDGIDFVNFGIVVNGRRNEALKKLCGKLSDIKEVGVIDGVLRYVGILNPKKEFEILSELSKGAQPYVAPVRKRFSVHA